MPIFRRDFTILAPKICILRFLELYLYTFNYETNKLNTMIHSFYVENYLSIKDRQEISFATTADKTVRDLVAVEVKPNVYINKLGIFYGANASGKSNILYALEAIFSLLCVTSYDKDKDVAQYMPFALCADEPTNMGVVFYKDGVKYSYEISYCRTHIISEKFEYCRSRSDAEFYAREYVGVDKQPKVTFGGTLKLSAKTRNTIVDNTFNNHTVLSTLAKVSLNDNASTMIDLYNWVKNRVHNVDGDYVSKSMIIEINKVCNDSQKKQFYLTLLNKADFNITNISIVDNTNEYPSQLVEQIRSSNMPDDEKFSILNDVSFTNHSDNGDFEVKSNFQSDGTKRFTELMDYLYDLVRENHIYLFDELGNRMHYDLMVYYIALMLYNSDQSQLFFTTHNILLLEEDFIRRDMVYLVEKDKSNAVSSYTRVSDMGLHKNLSLYNAYKIGRLGAKPDLGSPYLDNVKEC